MQHLCVRTAVQINPNDPDWQMTASGRPYNHKYGFGKLDAYAIVEAAKTWKLVKPQAWWQSPLAHADKVNTDLGMPITAEGATAALAVTAQDLRAANLEKLEHVTITVFIEHQRRGDIEVELVSPKGMKSILARPRRFDESPDGMMGWVFMSVKHWCVFVCRSIRPSTSGLICALTGTRTLSAPGLCACGIARTTRRRAPSTASQSSSGARRLIRRSPSRISWLSTTRATQPSRSLSLRLRSLP
jgi:hypothetical protein